MATAATGSGGCTVVEQTAVGHDRPVVGGEQPAEGLHPIGRAEPSSPARQQRDPGAEVELEPGQAVGRDPGTGRRPAAQPRVTGIGDADRGRHVAGQVDEQRARSGRAGQDEREGGRHDGGARTTLHGPTGDQHQASPGHARRRAEPRTRGSGAATMARAPMRSQGSYGDGVGPDAAQSARRSSS